MIHEEALKELNESILPGKTIVDSAKMKSAGHSTLPIERMPLALVYPESTQDVVLAVEWANKWKIPLWPVSRGYNWGYGSKTPISDSIVIVSLEKMNKIIQVDPVLHYADVEPGVTYRQLRAYLENHYPSLWLDCTDGPPEGSVLGNALDRGLGNSTYGDHFANICGFEVVTPTATVIYTGGGPKDSPSRATHKWGVGPYLEGLFAQGNFGIVTRGYIWLMPKPEKFVSFSIDIKHEASIYPVIDIIRELGLNNILRSFTHLLNEVAIIAVLSQYPQDLWKRRSSLPPDVLEKLKRGLDTPAWSFGGSISGTAAQVDEAVKILRKKFSPFGQITFLTDRKVNALQKILNYVSTGNPSLIKRWVKGALVQLLKRPFAILEAAPHIHSLLKGIPSDYFVRHAYFKGPIPKPELSDPDRDQVGLIWFAPVVPMSGHHIERAISICRPLYQKYDFDFYVALLVQNPRSMIVLQAIFFNQSNKEEAQRAERLHEELHHSFEEAGYYPYRTSLLGMPLLYKSQPAYHEFLNALQRSIDPVHIMSPGKYGVN